MRRGCPAIDLIRISQGMKPLPPPRRWFYPSEWDPYGLQIPFP